MDEFHDGQYPPSPVEEGVIDLISDSEIEDSPEIREVDDEVVYVIHRHT